jgi:hypothetical protein
MDPNIALQEARRLAMQVLYGDAEEGDEARDDLAIAFTALDKWLTSGGFPPAEWQPKPPAAA